MKNFKRILAIVLVVMMVVPMMTTGLSAATALMSSVQSNTGAEIADGNWKAFVYNDWSTHYGPALAAFDNLGTADVSAEGQIVLYNQIQTTYNGGFGANGFTCGNIRNALQSTNTTEINGLYFRNGMMPTQGVVVMYGETMSYAFSETQLQGALNENTYTIDEGFAVEGGMVSDGLVLTLTGGNASTNQTDLYSSFTAYVLENGVVVSSQSFDLSAELPVYVGVSANYYFSIVDGVLTVTVEDIYGLTPAVAFVFDELYVSDLKTDKSYYLAVGAGAHGAPNDTVNVDTSGSVNLNLARISDFVIAEDGTYTVTDSENKNVADWTGNGVASCEHVWGEYVEITAPTCTETGLLEAACQNGCGATDTKTVAALGHAWSDWANTTEPTCTEAGVRARSCGTCGAEQTDVAAALGHSWGDWYTTVEPECEYVGIEQRDCPVCGSYEEQVIPALGHAWVWVTLPNDTVNGERHCDVCGETETDLAYDYTYYWTPASNNKVGNIDASYAEYNDQFGVEVDGTITMQDLSYYAGGPYNYNAMLKLTSEFKSSLAGFTVTVDTLEDNNIGTDLEKEYPTILSFMWTTKKDNYDGATEFAVYTSLEGGNTSSSNRYGHIWNNYVADEYSLCLVLSDACFINGGWYGTLDDGKYEYLYYSIVSEGNYWTTKMPAVSVSAYEPITLEIMREINTASMGMGTYVVFNENYDNIIELEAVQASQLDGQDYYFSVAAYADGANAATASFQLVDVCGQSPATFAGYAHECSYYHETEATCTTDGVVMCMECTKVVSTTPATGHNFGDDFVCTNGCGTSAGAHIEGGEAYADLQAAIDAATAGDKIVLLDKQESGPYTVPAQKNIKIDINGFNIRNKSGDALIVDNANVEIYGTNGGTVRSSDGVAIVVKNNGYVTICDAITVRCSEEEGFNVFSLDETSGAAIIALGGRYYKDPTACGVELAPGLAISGEGTNWTVIEAPVEPETKDYVITFDPDGGVMPEGALLELPINFNENYKEAAGYDYPVPTAPEAGYVFAGWFLEAYNFVLTKGDWDGGYYALNSDCELIALYEECAHINMSDWTVTVEPQVGVAGEQTATCLDCGYVVTEEIPALEAPAKAYVITFDPDGGVMPEGALLELPINFNENYKEAAGYDYPVPTAPEAGYVFAGWFLEAYNFVLTKGDWDGGYYALNSDCELIALYEECAHANWSDWTVTVEPTYTAEGEQTRTCLDCGYVETAVVEKLERPWVITFDPDGGVMPEGVPTEMRIATNENYKEATGYDYPVPTAPEVGLVFEAWYWEAFNYMLYPGDWNGGYFAVAMDVSLIAIYAECVHANMSDWTVTVEPQVGVAGEQTATCLDCGYVVTEEIPALEAPAKDYVITFDPDGGIMPEGTLTELPINYGEGYKDAAGYDYPVPTLDGYVFAGWFLEAYSFVLTEGDWNGGYYALNSDCELIALWEEAPEVVAVAVDNTITVSNIDSSVRDIWVSAGEWYEYADVKANMIFRLKSDSPRIVDGTWSYMVADDGTYTVYIRYNDGTVEAKVFVVECQFASNPNFVQDGATVTFSNLEDLLVLRYVPGEYATSYEIKRAPGVVNVRGKDLVNPTFSVTLEPGTYTFVTQFHDGNYVYYTVVVEAPVVAKDYTITFDPDGGVMPEGALTELPINYGEGYKDAAGYDYPVPTLDGYVFAGWFLEAYSFVLTEGDWNGGYYALNSDCDLIALWEEA